MEGSAVRTHEGDLTSEVERSCVSGGREGSTLRGGYRPCRMLIDGG